MRTFVFPREEHREDLLPFYREFEENQETCIGYGDFKHCDRWLTGMRNRRTENSFPDGWGAETSVYAMTEAKWSEYSA